MGQVGLQVGHGLCRIAALGMGQAAVAPLAPGLGQQHDEAVQHRNQPLPVLLRAVHFFQVAQHARNDVAWRGGLQVKAQGHVVIVHQAIAALVGLQPLGQLFAAQ
ncbi:hypothetical protein D3C87_1932690 [compost metagenome]